MNAVHPDEATVLRWVLGDLPMRSKAGLEQHFADCLMCREEREATERLHGRLSDVGASLAFAHGDPFERRPVPREGSPERDGLATAMAAALEGLSAQKQGILFAIAADASAAANNLGLQDAACRLALAHVLEEAVIADPAERLAGFAAVMAGRVVAGAAEGEAVLPSAQLRVLAHLVRGNWQLHCGRPENAGVEFGAAWTALEEFDAPEHLIAWVEAGESLRRSYLGRVLEGRLLAERALATFERYGLGRGILRARHARAVALYMASRFRDAHREFRAVITSKHATGLDRARAVSGAAFCLVARGRFHEAAKEYSRVRRRLRGDGAQIEQCLLQGEMKVALGTAGRWHRRPDGLAAFPLPQADGAFHARGIAAGIVKAASELGIDAAKARLAQIEGDPAGRYALLYAAQLAAPKVSGNPALYVELAKALAAASRSRPFLKEKGPAQPVCREQVMGEAQLLESGSLNMLGRSREAVEAARQARVGFIDAGEDSFALALADYFEGSAESWLGNYTSAWKSLRSSLGEFQLYGQTNWAGRTEAALGTLLQHRNRNESALTFFNAALTDLHPVQDEVVYAITLSNRAFSLLLLRRVEAAKATYAKALAFARRLGMTTILFAIRYGLASIDLLKGQTFKAFHAFERIAIDAKAANLSQRVLTAELRVAECLGRLGKREEMLTRVRALRREIPELSIEFEAPLRDLFAQADSADVTSELIAHVVESLEARERGVQKGYKPFKLLRGGA
jgi:tetratricopeptide (TPR) repeat protein